MKKRLKILTICACSLVSITSLFSCKSNVSENNNKIIFWHTFGQNVRDQMQKEIDKFVSLVKENEGVDLEVTFSYVGSYDDILSQVEKGFAVGNVPTIAVCYPDHVASYLSHEDFDEEYVYNLSSLFNDSSIGYNKNPYLDDEMDENDFVSAFLKENSSYTKDGTYSLPLMKSTEVLMFNKDIVYNVLLPNYSKANNITIPSYDEYMSNLTWDEFISLLRFVKKDMNEGNSNYGTNLEVPCIYDSDENLYITQSNQRNISFLSINNGKGSIDFNNDQAKDMVKELKGYYDEGLLITKGTNNNEYGSNKFTVGKTLFTIGSSGGAGYNDPGAASFEVGVCKVPFANNNPLYVSQGPNLTLLRSNGVSDEVNEFRKEYGWKLMKYLTNTYNEVDLCYYGSEGYVPTRTSSYTYDYYADYLKEEEFVARSSSVVVNEINGKYYSTPTFKGSSNARDQVGMIITNVFLNKKSIDEAFKDAENNTKLGM